MHRSLLAACCSLLALGCALAAAAASPPAISVSIMPLAQDGCREGSPYPVTVSVLNGDPEFTGTLKCRLNDAAQPGTVAQALRIGKGLFRYPLYPCAQAWHGALIRADLYDAHGQPVATATAPVRPDPARAWVAVVQTQRRLLRPAELAAAETTVHDLPLTRLPDEWYGYELFDAVCWDGRNLDALTDRQRQALGDWVVAGGRLLIVAFPGDPTLTSPLPDLLPSLAFAAGLPGPAAFDAACRRAVTNAADAAAPLRFAAGILERQHGLGSVQALLAGPATAPAEPVKAALAPLLPAAVRPGDPTFDAAYERSFWSVREALWQSAGYARRSYLPLFLLLALYITLVSSGDYLLLKFTNRLPWTWVTFPATILVFAVLVPLWFYRGQPSILRRNDVLVEDRGLDGGGRAWTLSVVGKPAVRPVSFRIAGGHWLHETAEWDVHNRRQGPRERADEDGLTVVTDATGTLAQISGPIGSYHFFSEEWPLAPAPGNSGQGRLAVRNVPATPPADPGAPPAAASSWQLTGSLAAPATDADPCAFVAYLGSLYECTATPGQLRVDAPIDSTTTKHVARHPQSDRRDAFPSEGHGLLRRWLWANAAAAAQSGAGHPPANTLAARTDGLVRHIDERPDLAVLFTLRRTVTNDGALPATRWVCTRQLIPVELNRGPSP